MKKCVPSCLKKKDDKQTALVAATNLQSEQQRICTQCTTSQSVAKDSTVFVCISCHTVNRVVGPDQDATTNTITPSIVLKRLNSSTFIPVSESVKPPVSVSTPVVSSMVPIPTIGLCSVCMDGPGDMIFLKCNHGGFCEPCARHIAQNMAVGGSHCPRCRQPIEAIVRIIEMNNDVVKAVEIEVEENGGVKKNQPPKVPPPRGYNKAKKQ